VIFSTSKKIICAKCGATGKFTEFEVPAITFNFLHGYVSVCERCVARALGVPRDWHPDVNDLISYEEKAT
jgi:hypothetical protein